MSRRYYDNVRKICGGIIRWLYRVEIIGSENEPADGPLLICANHISNADVVVMASSMKRQVRFFAKAEIFKVPLLSWFVRNMGAVPVKRGAGDVNAIKTVISLLGQGEMVGFYPQGHRRPAVDPASTELAHGLGLIEWRTRATVLPVAIVTKARRIKAFRRTKFIILKPIPYDELAFSAGTPDEYKRVTEYAFSRVIEAENAAWAELNK